MTTKDFIKKDILPLGYCQKKCNGGSHVIYECKGKPTISIPNHREIAPGTKRNILKLAMGESYYGK